MQSYVQVPTGLSPWRLKLREAVRKHAVDQGHTHYAMPLLVDKSPDAWLVYATNPHGVPQFEGRFPTRDSAEMWMVSHG